MRIWRMLSLLSSLYLEFGLVKFGVAGIIIGEALDIFLSSL